MASCFKWQVFVWFYFSLFSQHFCLISICKSFVRFHSEDFQINEGYTAKRWHPGYHHTAPGLGQNQREKHILQHVDASLRTAFSCKIPYNTESSSRGSHSRRWSRGTKTEFLCYMYDLSNKTSTNQQDCKEVLWGNLPSFQRTHSVTRSEGLAWAGLAGLTHCLVSPWKPSLKGICHKSFARLRGLVLSLRGAH